MELHLSEGTKQVIRQLLKTKDVNGDGVIDKSELCHCLMVVGFCPTPDEADFLRQHFDRSGDGKLEIDDIIDNLDVIMAHSVQGHQLMDAFNKFDIAGDGFIRTRELEQILTADTQYKMAEDEAKHLIQDLLQNFDENKDGKFSYSEFVRMVMRDGLPDKGDAKN